MKLLLLLKALMPGGAGGDLFATPSHIAGYTNKDGTYVAPHTALRRKARAPSPAAPPLFDTPAFRAPSRPTPVRTNPQARSTAGMLDLFSVTHPDPAPSPTAEAAPKTVEPEARPEPPNSAEIGRDFGVSAGVSPPERRRLNAAAVALLNSKSDDEMTGADRAALAKYSGNGGCGDSLNEFYTPAPVAAAMWSLLARAGFTGGDVLEPSAGTGIFLHTAPSTAKVQAVELDPISSRISRILHPTHASECASLERFATQDGRLFDAVIGNPPFGPRGALLADDKRGIAKAEHYFLDTALDKTRDGGLVAVIVPSSVMDASAGRSFRQDLNSKAEFLGGSRMPNSAFEASHTDVTTDVLLFRKRPQEISGALGVLSGSQMRELGAWDEDFIAGSYFTEGRGQANAHGTAGTVMRQFGPIYSVHGSMVGVPAAIEAMPIETPPPGPAMQDVLKLLGGDEDAKRRAVSAALKPPYQTAKPGDVRVVDGVRYVLQGEPPRWHRAEEELHPAVRDALAATSLLEDLAEGRAVSPAYTRLQLQEALAQWVGAHGQPGKSKALAAFLTQPSMPNTDGASPEQHGQRVAAAARRAARLLGAVNADGSYSDLVTGERREVSPLSLETLATTLSLEAGGFTVPELAAKAGCSESDAEDHLHASPTYAVFPDGQTWATLDTYVAGDLWPKYDAARAAAADPKADPALVRKWEMQAAALDAAIAPAVLEDVEITLGSGFVTPADINAWLATTHTGKDVPTVTFDPSRALWEGAHATYGNADLILRALNRKGVKRDERDTLERLNREFGDWVRNSDRREAIEDRYNRAYRGFRAPTYSDAPIAIPGMVTEGLKGFQYPGVRWALEAGSGIVAADVGLGKTVRGLMLAKLMQSTGRSEKPVIVVPKSVLANWLAEAEKWFPGSRVLTIGESYSVNKADELVAKPDDEKTRRAKYHQLQQNTYDFVFISQPAWNDLDINPALKGELADGDFWAKRGDALGNAGDKRLNDLRTRHEQALAQRDFADREHTIYFDDLGIDGLIMDEGHCFPAGTLIDGRPIESYRAGDAVMAFDHAKGRVVVGRVSNLQVRRVPGLLRVRFSDGTILVCTGKHPFFTPDGYVFAERLKAGNVTYKNPYVAGHEESRRSLSQRRSATRDSEVEVQQLQGFDAANEGAGLAPARARPDLVLLREAVRHALETGATRHSVEDRSGSDQRASELLGSSCYPSHEAWQSDGATGCAREGFDCFDRPTYKEARRERERPNSPAGNPTGGFGRGLVSGVYRSADVSEAERLAVVLCDRSCAPGAQAGCGSGRPVAQDGGGSGAGPKEGDALVPIGVDSVEVLEPGSDGGYGGMCPGSVVFNIEVEHHHNYFASGVLVHNSFKNLYAARNRFGETPKFLGGSGLSNRAQDTFFKSKVVRDRTGGKNVYMLTATPTKNSPLEVYSMLAHIAPEAFEKMGIKNSEDFLDRFCEFSEDEILTVDGKLEDALVTSGFKNLDELREVMRRYIDRKTAEDVGLVIPRGDPVEHYVDMTSAQEAAYQVLRAEVEAAKQKDASGDSHIFSVMSRMGKAAIDLSLLGGEEGNAPKVDACVAEAVKRSAEGGQVIFCDHIDLHEKIAAKLVAAGVPRSAIGIINARATNSSAARQRVCDQFNAGKITHVIGNTPCMGEGVNLQKGTTDIHHLDLPWEPASMQQRNGRGVRQGNTKEAVRLHTYLAKRSFDGYRLQTIKAKKDWQDLLWNGGDRVENLARESAAMYDPVIMFAADPEAAMAKRATDKEAATAAKRIEQRGKAFESFASYNKAMRAIGDMEARGVKVETSDALKRLYSKVTVMRDRLGADEQFTHKHLLDTRAAVVIEPNTGFAWQAGTGLTLAGGDEGAVHYAADATRWIVSSVNPEAGTVTARPYGRIATTAVTMELDRMKAGVTPFDASAADERALLTADAKIETGPAGVMKLHEIRNLPPEVIREHQGAINRRMMHSIADYTDTSRRGTTRDHYGAFGKDGVPTVVPSFSARKMSPETHDLVLPIPEHREQAVEAYVNEGMGRTIGSEYIAGHRHRQGESRSVARYPSGGHSGQHNPWGAVLRDVFGGNAEQEAKGKVQERTVAAIHGAETFRAAVRAAIPGLHFPSYAGLGEGTHDAWPAPVAAALRAKAEKLGVIDQVVQHAIGPNSRYGLDRIDDAMFKHKGERFDGGAYGSGNRTVGQWMNAIGSKGEAKD